MVDESVVRVGYGDHSLPLIATNPTVTICHSSARVTVCACVRVCVKVTVTEIECDHSCTWEAARQLYEANVAKPYCGFFVAKDANGRPNLAQLFLAIPVDAARVRMCYPHRVSSCVIPNDLLRTGAFSFNMLVAAHQQQVCSLWQKNYAACVLKKWHLESFALLNGSVFSIW